PAAVSRACAPDPAWSPTCRVTLDRLCVLAEPFVAVLAPVLADDELPAELLLDEEQAAASRPTVSRLAVSGRTRLSVARGPEVIIMFPPSWLRARPAGRLVR